MNVHPVLVYRDEGGVRLSPTAGIEVFHAVPAYLHCLMGVSAEDSIRISVGCILQRALRHFVGQAEPYCVKALQETDNSLSSERDFLQPFVNQGKHSCKQTVCNQEAVELVAMNGQVAASLKLPFVFLVDGDAYEMRHEFGEPVIVVALHPHDFDATFRIR